MNLNAAKLLFVLGPLLIMFSSNCSLPFNSRRTVPFLSKRTLPTAWKKLNSSPRQVPNKVLLFQFQLMGQGMLLHKDSGFHPGGVQANVSPKSPILGLSYYYSLFWTVNEGKNKERARKGNIYFPRLSVTSFLATDFTTELMRVQVLL